MILKLACIIKNLREAYISIDFDSMDPDNIQAVDVSGPYASDLLCFLQMTWHREKQQTFEAIECLLTMQETNVPVLQKLRMQAINHFLDLAAGVFCQGQCVPSTALLNVLLSTEKKEPASRDTLYWLQWRNTLPALLAAWSIRSLRLNPENKVANALQVIPTACMQALCAGCALHANQRTVLNPIITQLVALSFQEDALGCIHPDETEESKRVLCLVAQLITYILTPAWEVSSDLAAIGMFGCGVPLVPQESKPGAAHDCLKTPGI